MKASLKRLVRKKARFRCEYCHIRRADDPYHGFHIEHIIPRKHGGDDSPENLAYACFHCNLHKGANLSGFDPLTGRVVRLFHPRRQRWSAHFYWNGPVAEGSTPTGRATIEVLGFNQSERVELRRRLGDIGRLPT